MARYTEAKGMPCPVCSGPTRTVDSRALDNLVRRRRHCKVASCAARFTTEERFISFDARGSSQPDAMGRRLKYEASQFAEMIPK